MNNLESYDSKVISTAIQRDKEQKDKQVLSNHSKDLSPARTVSAVSRDKEKPVNLSLLTE